MLDLAGCDEAGAPTTRGVCWITAPEGYRVLAKDVASLEDCAALLESVRLEGASRANGAFQGYFIFVDGGQISASQTSGGFRYPVFQPAQRREIDADLEGLIEARHGRPLGAADVAVERR